MPYGSGGLSRQHRRAVKRLAKESRAAAGVGTRKILAIRAVPIEALLDLGMDAAPLSAFLDFVGTVAGGGTRRCGGCDHVFTRDNEAPAAIVLIAAAIERPSTAMCTALCRDCAGEDLRSAAEHAAKRVCGDDFKVLDPKLFATGGRA